MTTLRPIQIRDAQRQLIALDETDTNMMVSRAGTDNIKYKGLSRPGTALTDAGWKIKRYTYDSTDTVVRSRTATSIDLADYNNIWDDSVAVVVQTITKASPGVVTTTTDHGYTTGDWIEIVSSNMTEVNGDGYGSIIFQVVKTGAATFTMKDVNGTALDTSGYTSAGTSGNIYKRDYLNHNYQ